MPKHRFYLESENWNTGSSVLSDPEAHHCRDVLRCAVGERILVFDGRGCEAIAVITSVSSRLVELTWESKRKTAPLRAQIVLGQCIPKGKTMDLIIQKATELGVTRVVPLISQHTVVRIESPREAIKKRDKWQRVAIEACKQCGQNWLPEIGLPMPVAEFVRSTESQMKIVAAIEGESSPVKSTIEKMTASRGGLPDSVSVLIGPEGDLTHGEINDAIEAGFQAVSLGPITLRSETAAIYSVSVLAYELMER